MPVIAPSWTQVKPSYTHPQVIMPYLQLSGAFETLAERAPQARLGQGDLAVYMSAIDVRTKIAAGNSAYNQLPSATITFSQKSTPTYLFRTRAEYDHHDTAAVAHRGVSIEEAHRLAGRQGIFQGLRAALLTGQAPQNGEGLLNTPGATAVTLPADSNGNTTVSAYDNGQLALFMLSQLRQLKTRTFQAGVNNRFVILGPQEVLLQMEYDNIVQLTQFQRPGAGTASTGEMIRSVAESNGDEITWVYDDTLKGKGAGGTDAVIITMPELPANRTSAGIATNEFTKLNNGATGTNFMFCDMAAPMEIPTPIPGGAIDIVFELRSTSGWNVRPETITIISMPY